MTMLSVEIDDSTQTALDALAHAKHQTVDVLVKLAIDALLIQEAEFQEDDRRWSEYLSAGGVESGRVMDWLDQWSKGDRQSCPQ